MKLQRGTTLDNFLRGPKDLCNGLCGYRQKHSTLFFCQVMKKQKLTNDFQSCDDGLRWMRCGLTLVSTRIVRGHALDPQRPGQLLKSTNICIYFPQPRQLRTVFLDSLNFTALFSCFLQRACLSQLASLFAQILAIQPKKSAQNSNCPCNQNCEVLSNLIQILLQI